MTVHAFSLTTAASAEAVFRELADIERFPCWAAEYCERLELTAGGDWRAYTIQGDLLLELEADARTGVIDLHLGCGERCEQLLPLRVVTLPGGCTLVSAILYQLPEQSDFAFAGQCAVFAAALRGLLVQLERADGAAAGAGRVVAV